MVNHSPEQKQCVEAYDNSKIIGAMTNMGKSIFGLDRNIVAALAEAQAAQDCGKTWAEAFTAFVKDLHGSDYIDVDLIRHWADLYCLVENEDLLDFIEN